MTDYTYKIATQEFKEWLKSKYQYDETNPDFHINLYEDLEYFLEHKYMNDWNSIICSYGIGKALVLHKNRYGDNIYCEVRVQNVEFYLAFIIIWEYFDEDEE
jgi:hypothetical protein